MQLLCMSAISFARKGYDRGLPALAAAPIFLFFIVRYVGSYLTIKKEDRRSPPLSAATFSHFPLCVPDPTHAG